MRGAPSSAGWRHSATQWSQSGTSAIGILELTIPRWLCIRLYEAKASQAKASQTKPSSQTKASEQNH
jgi:hypothetical protein